jgi:hypothetical protein
MAKTAKAKRTRTAKKSGAKAKARRSTHKSGRKRAPTRSRAANKGRNGTLDEGLRQTFPSSDPPAATNPTRSIRE